MVLGLQQDHLLDIPAALQKRKNKQLLGELIHWLDEEQGSTSSDLLISFDPDNPSPVW